MISKYRIAIIGLGYVGLTVAIYFSKKFNVIGFDINEDRLSELRKGYDRNNEVSKKEILSSSITFTTDQNLLSECNFYIVIVPTPINAFKEPDLSKLLNASTLVGKYLKPGDIVVYESTVFPGATEELCIPKLEEASKLTCGRDFTVGYSPERINPGDKIHTLENITKIISATDQNTLNTISGVYSEIINTVYPVSSIKVAEATKVIENTQRDLNISLMNEIALILHHCNMSISEILEAAKTKWNAITFKPGLVGGHCLGTNSYYLVHKSREMGYEPNFILAGQHVNDNLVQFIADETLKSLIHLEKPIKNARIGVLGITYKENYPDFHDSRVIELIEKLNIFELNVLAHDPLVDYQYAMEAYPLNLIAWDALTQLDAVIIAVAHRAYCELTTEQIKNTLKPNGIVIDVKGILDPQQFKDSDITLWRI